MNPSVAPSASLWILLPFFLIGTKSLSSTWKPVSASDIVVSNELMINETNNAEHQDDDNITEIQYLNWVECYDECINITKDGADCKSTPIYQHDPNIPCNLSCWYEVEQIHQTCPFLLEETKDYISLVKFWLDGVLKVFSNLRCNVK